MRLKQDALICQLENFEMARRNCDNVFATIARVVEYGDCRLVRNMEQARFSLMIANVANVIWDENSGMV